MPVRRGNRFDVPVGVAPEDEFGLWTRVAPRVEADLAAVIEPPIRVAAVADDGDPTSAHLELRHPDGYQVPVFVEVSDDDEQRALVEVFKAVLESAVFDETGDPWPRCPRHPEAGHSLTPALSRGKAIWQCPTDRAVITEVGTLIVAKTGMEPAMDFGEERQSEWSERVLVDGALPTTIPDRLTDHIVVPLAFAIDEPYGAVLHVMLWEDDDQVVPRCDVEVLFRADDGWSSAGSGGSSWPSFRLAHLDVDELGSRSLLVLGDCEIGTPVGVGAFTYGMVSMQARGVEFTDSLGARRQWPKMHCGAFVIPTSLIGSSLTAWW